MKKVLWVAVLFAMLLTLLTHLISCEKNDTSAANNSNQTGSNDTVPKPIVLGNPIYSGTWTGAIDVTDRNPDLCTFTGDPVEVTQEWVVNTNGSVVIEEIRIESGDTTPYKFKWEGLMYNQDSISLSLNTAVNCFGAGTVLNAKMNARIKKISDSKYELAAKVDYPICPPDCVFYFNYTMKN